MGEGTILEASFVDPAYSYPPAEGQGRNAIELQATSTLLKKVEPGADDQSLDLDSPSVTSVDTADLSITRAPEKAERELRNQKVRVSRKTTEETYEYRGFSFLKCCRSSAQTTFVEQEYGMEEPTKIEIKEARSQAIDNIENMKELQIKRRKMREQRRQENIARRAKRAEYTKAENEQKKYSVAEGILIYRLNTANRTISLVSGISSNTDTDNLMREMVVTHAAPSNDRTRRGICLVGVDGSRATITACEQRTAIAWLEAFDLMLSKKQNKGVSCNFYILEDHFWFDKIPKFI